MRGLRHLIEPGIVDRHGGAAGEFLDQGDIRRTVAPRPLAKHTRDGAQHPATGYEGDHHFGLESQRLLELPMRRIPGLGPQSFRGHGWIEPGLARAQHPGERMGGIGGEERIVPA